MSTTRTDADEPARDNSRPKPFLIPVAKGKTYLWCACGRSARQPFCDGSHEGSGFQPIVWKADEAGEKLFCGCKQTAAAPFCDGTHNRLSDTYGEAEPGDRAHALLVDFEQEPGGILKARLDNGCYVVRVPASAMLPVRGIQMLPLIGKADGARHISQFLTAIGAGRSRIFEYPGSDVVVFVQSGNGAVRIHDRTFRIAPETGICIKPGEGFQFVNENVEPMVLILSVCPPCASPGFPPKMPATFDETVADRVQGVDESRQEAMADRFFQVLIDEGSHRTPVTLFIGNIPCSRAEHHRHLYEEAITVLEGEGVMWTDDTRTRVEAGDTIFLPLKQMHSLECTSPGGMRLVGLFFPSMSPAINY